MPTPATDEGVGNKECDSERVYKFKNMFPIHGDQLTSVTTS